MKMYWIKSMMSFFPLLIFAAASAQQDWQLQMGDKWFNEHQGLKVGDEMPDIPLGTVLNNKTAKTRFSEFRGKLVILDMWSTNCSSCIAFFPKMEKLQKEFGDKIQIFTVNPYEDKEHIDFAFRRRDSARPTHTILPDLPAIVGAKELLKLFPARYVPHQIWIDQNGIVRVIGPELNIYEKKIEDLLSGKEISYVNDDDNTPGFNPKIPYHKIIGDKFQHAEKNVFITPYNRDYSAKSSGYSGNLVEGAQVRITWINTPIVDIYRKIFEKESEELHRKTLFQTFYRLPISLKIKDTARFTDEFISIYAINFKLTDTDYIKSRLCYEVITPQNISEEARRKIVLNKLGNYLKTHYGAEVKLEKIKTPCYVLIRTSDKERFRSLSGEKDVQKISTGDKTFYQLKQCSVGEVISYSIGGNLRSAIYANAIDTPFVLLDETHYAKPLDITVPEAQSLEELKEALEKYDLAIIKTERTIPWLIISENSSVAANKKNQ